MTAIPSISALPVNAERRIPADAIPASELGAPKRTIRWLFNKLQAEGKAWKHPNGMKYFDAKHPLTRKHLPKAGVADDAWSNASPEAQKAAQQRCEFIEAVEKRVDGLTGQGGGRVKAYRRACWDLSPEILGQTVKVGTFYLWKKKYLDSGRRRSSMVDTRGRKSRAGDFCAEAWRFFEGLWLDPRRRGVRWCYAVTATEARKHGWPWPAYRTVARWTRKIWPAHKADYYRLGPLAWEAKHAPKIIRDKRDLPGNQMWEVDHLRFDFWARYGSQRTRPWCSVIVDRATNVPVGWAITTNPSSNSLAVAIRRAVLAWGPSNEVTLDNGKDMKACSFGNKRPRINEAWVGGVFEQLDVAVHWCEVRHPWAKGTVESLARTIHEQFDKAFPSYCGSTPFTRPVGVDRWARENIDNLPDLPEVDRLFGEWVEGFMDRPSDAQGIKPLSPRQKMEANRINRRPADETALNFVLLPLSRPRKVTAKGIWYAGFYYKDDGGELFNRQGQNLCVRSDPKDISWVWVCHPHNGDKICRATQNLAKGTADDVRKGKTRVDAAKKAVKKGRELEYVATYDVPTATLVAAAQHHRHESAKHAPDAPPLPPILTPIRTPALDAATEAAPSIRAEELKLKARQAGRRPVTGVERFPFEDIAAGPEKAVDPLESDRSWMEDFLDGDVDAEINYAALKDEPGGSMMAEYFEAGRDADAAEIKAG